MIVHSNNGKRDYYDRVMAAGIDTTLHYGRTPKDVWLSSLSSQIAPRLNSILGGSRFLIGFCGQIYTGVKLTRPLVKNGVKQYTSAGTVIEENLFLYYPHYSKKELEILLKPDDDSYRRFRFSNQYSKENQAVKFLMDVIKNDDIFAELNAPIFVTTLAEGSSRMIQTGFEHIRDHKITVNGLLKDFEFYRVVDPFSAYQNIAHYLGNVLVDKKKFPDIADKYKIEQHGFDKTSFRNPIRLSQLK